jgi:mannose-6-phosphate isomerase-like protein (cupin superfamily)
VLHGGLVFHIMNAKCDFSQSAIPVGGQMNHIQAKQHTSPPEFLTVKIAPIDPIPESSFIRDYGLDTLAPGASSDLHFHDCDEWWIITEGIARLFHSDEKIQVGPGDMVFTPAGESHKIEAVTLVKVVWFEGPLQGQKRKGHLHP